MNVEAVSREKNQEELHAVRTNVQVHLRHQKSRELRGLESHFGLTIRLFGASDQMRSFRWYELVFHYVAIELVPTLFWIRH
jgi:hypothetical protein